MSGSIRLFTPSLMLVLIASACASISSPEPSPSQAYIATTTQVADEDATMKITVEPSETPVIEDVVTMTPEESSAESVVTEETESQQTFMNKLSPEYIRLMNYNVNWDSIFPDIDPMNHEWRTTNKAEAFRRIIKAINPDIVCLQEINPERDPKHVSVIFDEVLPLENGAEWQAVIASDNFILSRFDLETDGYSLYTSSNPDLLAQSAALINLPDDEYGPKDIYLICAHFAAFGGQEKINKRQMQADVIIRQVGDLKTPGGYIDLAPGTPFIIAGDFNIYDTDPAYHLTTLITGDIVYENQFGEDIQPDWDDTPLTDANPSHNGREVQYYTWRNDESEFIPGALDRVIYSDSLITARYSIILNTKILSLKNILKYELQADDVMMNGDLNYFDHLPIVVDFDLNN